MTDDIVIRVEKLWKRYGLPLLPALRHGMRRLLGHPAGDDGPWALQGLDLSVRRGETLGVIGRNGAGKSTLLKVLAGVSPPTRGRVSVCGSIFPMIELNAGMHNELTGRENTYLLGAVMGLTTRQITTLLPEVEEFCELDEWFDRPVRIYSSGMLARLGFALAVNVNAEVLLVDEVLAVGDITFQRKCFDRIERLHASGCTVMFVSHSIRQVERLCDRVLLLEQGRPVACGDPADVISNYYHEANLRIMEHRTHSGETVRILQEKLVDAPVDIINIRFLDQQGNATLIFATGDPWTIEVTYLAHQPVYHANIGIGISTVDALYVSGMTNEQTEHTMTLEGTGRFRCTITSMPLLTGIYTIHLKIRQQNGSVVGGGTSLAAFSMSVPDHLRLSSDYGLVMMNARWEQPVTIRE